MNVTRQLELAPLTQSWPLLHAHSLTVRALRPEDADLEARFGLALSAESRYDRFLTGGVKLDEALLRRLVNVDFSRDMALIAVVTLSGVETPVGIARYALAPDDSAAEIAVTVADSWQGCGLGRLLLERLIEVARRNGREIRRRAGDERADDQARPASRFPRRLAPRGGDAATLIQGARRRASGIRRRACSGGAGHRSLNDG